MTFSSPWLPRTRFRGSHFPVPPVALSVIPLQNTSLFSLGQDPPFHWFTFSRSTLLNFFCLHYRRKFRSQTSDNMDRWKSRGGKSQRREEEEDQRRERVRRKKMQVREKVEKLRINVFFQWLRSWKVASLKRRVRSHLAGWEMKNCTPFRREAHFEVKTYKTRQLRSTFRNWDVEKAHAVVARSAFRSQNVQNAPFSFKKRAPLWREAHFEVKMYKAHQCRTTFGSWDVEKVHAVVARSTFRSQKCKELAGSNRFWTFRCCFAWQAQGTVHLVKSAQNLRVL